MVVESKSVRRLMVGVYDAPLEQKQPILEIDLLSANVAIFGSKQSGKTTFVKNILIRLHEIIRPEILGEEIYVLDLNSTMGDYDKLPFICGCFGDSNEEDVKTLFTTVRDKLKWNNDILRQTKRSSITQFLEDPPENAESKPGHITLVIENMNAFLAQEQFSLYHEMLLNFCRDGISKGLTVLFTANGVSGGVTRYLPNMESIVAFDMSSEQAMDIFNEKPPQLLHVPGRGIVKKEGKLYEFQGFLPFESEKHELLPFIQAAAERISPEYLPTRLISFTKILTVENFSENTYGGLTYARAVEENRGIVLGLDYYKHEPVCLIPDESRCIGIYGKKSFGKTNLLNLLVGNLLLRDSEQISTIIMFDDGRRELEGLEKYIKESTIGIELQVFHDRPSFSAFVVKLCDYLEQRTKERPTAITETAQSAAVSQDLFSLNHDVSEDPLGGTGVQDDLDFLMGIEPSSPKPLQNAQPAVPVPPPAPAHRQVQTGTGILFIIQSKSMYQESPSRGTIGVTLESLLATLINEAEQNKMMFIFSDVKKHPDLAMDTMIGGFFSKIFLLNDIADFVDNKGSKTALGEFDAKELKLEYAKCELGDGYYFDVDRDELIKAKFLKSPFNIKPKNDKS